MNKRRGVLDKLRRDFGMKFRKITSSKKWNYIGIYEIIGIYLSERRVQ